MSDHDHVSVRTHHVSCAFSSIFKAVGIGSGAAGDAALLLSVNFLLGVLTNANSFYLKWAANLPRATGGMTL